MSISKNETRYNTVYFFIKNDNECKKEITLQRVSEHTGFTKTCVLSILQAMVVRGILQRKGENFAMLPKEDENIAKPEITDDEIEWLTIDDAPMNYTRNIASVSIFTGSQSRCISFSKEASTQYKLKETEGVKIGISGSKIIFKVCPLTEKGVFQVGCKERWAYSIASKSLRELLKIKGITNSIKVPVEFDKNSWIGYLERAVTPASYKRGKK